jgi:hypothetical protein
MSSYDASNDASLSDEPDLEGDQTAIVLDVPCKTWSVGAEMDKKRVK